MFSKRFTQSIVRNLNLYERQAKSLFSQYEIPHQRGFTATTVDEALFFFEEIKEKFNVESCICKAQVLAGGRGKGHFDNGFQGGVKFCSSKEKMKEAAENMLGNRIFTKQTPPNGILVEQLFVAECLDFDRELYFALLLDRECGGPVFIASEEGGVEIEEIAKNTPEKITSVVVDLDEGVTNEQIDLLCDALSFTEEEDRAEFSNIVLNMYQMFQEKDLTLVEVNPLVHGVGGGGVKCLDAKFIVDDNALFRQTQIDEEKDLSELDEKEIRSKEFDLTYIKLDGNIGCMVNGAGLAMATMDIISLEGGAPANFLDVGGAAGVENIKEAFKIICSDDNVDAILVNIFGGIMKCDLIADGLIQASEEIEFNRPLIVRLEGTNSELGLEMLKQSNLDIHYASHLRAAAKIAVDLSL